MLGDKIQAAEKVHKGKLKSDYDQTIIGPIFPASIGSHQ